MTAADPLLALYQHLAANQAAGPQAIRDLPADERRAYTLEAVRRHRQKLRQDGALRPTAPVVRQLLADAAIMLLATDGPGAEQVRAVLSKAFPEMPGLPLTITNKAKAGRLKPKYAMRSPS